jgi:uncharacterized protein HemX
MAILLILALATGLFGLIFIKRQENAVANRFSYKKSKKTYSKEDYLKTVIKNTNERLNKEKQEQEYKNKIKKNYL